jgi:hypothetical protein
MRPAKDQESVRTHMNRRQFLALTATGGGYSLLVRAGAQPDSPDLSREDIGAAIESLHPAPATTRRPAHEPHMQRVDLQTDLCIAGGGMAGVCAALAAARNGARVLLLQDRSRLGGNASSEVKMHIVGADHHGNRPGWREGGLIEELRLEDAVHNPHRSWELWDLLLYDKLRREPNITLLLDTTLFSATTRRNRIQQVLARCDKTEYLYSITAPLYLDATGDSRLALEAGAEFRVGREPQSEFNEPLGRPTADRQTLGSSILFTARDYGRPILFSPPPWARRVTRDQLRFRPISSWEYGYWWIEWGGQLNTIRDNERIRFELLAIVLGVWDYIKNSGQHPSSAHWAMDWIGMIPGKRESRRLVGDYMLVQQDLQDPARHFDDAVAIGGWPLDDHPPDGFDRSHEPPFTSIPLPEVYPIPFRCLYSRNIQNLLMAGRNLSASHVAFSSTRVMATCAVAGQAAGTAAALCARHRLLPHQIAHNPARRTELQQTLLRDDQTIKGLANTDPHDLARRAHISASEEHGQTRAIHAVNGFVRDLPGQWANRWAAPLTNGEAWLDLEWPQPVTLQSVQLTFDTGFQRELTLSASDSHTRKMIRGPQPETVRDYELIAYDHAGHPTPLATIQNNYLRLRRHAFTPVTLRRLRLRITASHGNPLATLYEIRAYGPAA